MIMSGRRVLHVCDCLVKHARLHNAGMRLLTTSAISLANTPVLPAAFPAYMIWGANTDVGKTLFSAGLAAAASRLQVLSA